MVATSVGQNNLCDLRLRDAQALGVLGGGVNSPIWFTVGPPYLIKHLEHQVALHRDNTSSMLPFMPVMSSTSSHGFMPIQADLTEHLAGSGCKKCPTPPSVHFFYLHLSQPICNEYGN